MRMFGHLKAVPMALLGLSFVFFACSSESTSSSSDDSPETEYSSTKGESSSSESDKDSNKKSSSSTAKDEPTVSEKSSSSVKQETVSGQEALNEPQNKINGSCGPSSDKINKGDIATWQFFRDEGEVWDQILAPFVWTFEGTASKSIQGNGLNQVNIRYENSGTYTASLLVDGNSDPKTNVETLCIVGGDGKSASIAAASILAKVYRDKMMDDYAKEYPQYAFDSNKGYGTAAHIQAIKEQGLCPIHRRTFTKNF